MGNFNNSLKLILNGSILVLFGIVISKFLGYAFRVIVSRVGPREYGILSLGLAVFGLIITFALIGMNYGVVRYVAFYKGQKNKAAIKGTITSALKMTLPFSILLAFLLFISSNFISLHIFNEPKLSIILKIFAFAIPLDTIKRIALTAIKGYQKLKYEVYVKDLIEGSVKILLTIILISLGFKALGAAIGYLIALFVAAFFALFFLETKVFPIFKTKLKSIKLYKELLGFSWPMMFSEILNSFLLWTDTFMLGFFASTIIVGIYNAAVPTANLMFIVPLALGTLFLPVITETYAKADYLAFKKLYKIINKWVFIINLLPLSLFVLFPKQVLTILFTNSYLAGYSVLIILSIAYFINSLSMTSKVVLTTMKKTKFIFVIVLISALLNILLNSILIPHFGIVGASISTAFSSIFLAFLLNIYAYKASKINIFTKEYFGIFISILIPSFLMGLINFKFQFVRGLFSLISVFLIIFCQYLILLFLTKSLQKEDLLIIQLIKKTIQKTFASKKTN